MSECVNIFTESKTDQICTIARRDKNSNIAYMLIAKAPGTNGDNDSSVTINLNGRISKIHHVYHFMGTYETIYQSSLPDDIKKGDFDVIGANIVESEDINSFGSVFYDSSSTNDYIHFSNLPASFVCILECEHAPDQIKALNKLDAIINDTDKR